METKRYEKLSNEELKFLKALQYVDVFKRKDKRKEKDGFIYLVKDNASNRIKIGITTNHKDRLRSLNTMVPYGITTIAVFQSGRYEELEKEVHEKYKDKRKNGEWFELNNDELKDCIEYIEKK